MPFHIERTWFVVLGRIVMNDSRSKISRFKKHAGLQISVNPLLVITGYEIACVRMVVKCEIL